MTTAKHSAWVEGGLIVRYRDELGRFDTLRQLEEVLGLAGKVVGLNGMVRFG